MKKLTLIIVLALILLTAYGTKPDDKTCIIESVKSVWGNLTPDVSKPQYFEQFMNLTSQSVEVDDWIFLKRIRYRTANGYATIGIGAFKNVFTVKRFK